MYGVCTSSFIHVKMNPLKFLDFLHDLPIKFQLHILTLHQRHFPRLKNNFEARYWVQNAGSHVNICLAPQSLPSDLQSILYMYAKSNLHTAKR